MPGFADDVTVADFNGHAITCGVSGGFARRYVPGFYHVGLITVGLFGGINGSRPGITVNAGAGHATAAVPNFNVLEGGLGAAKDIFAANRAVSRGRVGGQRKVVE